MQYPTPSALQACLKNLATGVADSGDRPFRVDMLPVYGGKPPMYTVVILSPAKERLREKLGEILNRLLLHIKQVADAAVLVFLFGHTVKLQVDAMLTGGLCGFTKLQIFSVSNTVGRSEYSVKANLLRIGDGIQKVR